MQQAPAPLRSFAGLVALADHRLTASGAGRAGLLGAAFVALVSIGEILATPAGADAGAVAVGAASVLAWLGAGPALLAAAGAQEQRDRSDGVERLAALRGHGAARQAAARMLAVVRLVVRRVGLLAMALCLLGAAHAGVLTSLFRRLIGLAGFALMAGVVLAVLAEACARLGGKRATSLLVAALLVPWALAEPLGRPGWSIPGALDAALGHWTGTALLTAKPTSVGWRWW